MASMKRQVRYVLPSNFAFGRSRRDDQQRGQATGKIYSFTTATLTLNSACSLAGGAMNTMGSATSVRRPRRWWPRSSLSCARSRTPGLR